VDNGEGPVHTAPPIRPERANNDNGALESSTMPIAIVGMSCRLPGSATGPSELWKMLSEGRSGWSEEASLRSNMKAFYHPASEMSGAVCEQNAIDRYIKLC
jgi:hypothetical protein